MSEGKTHRVRVYPGDSIEVELVEKLCNGYPDHVGNVWVTWQDRDAPVGEIATEHRELQVDWSVERGKVGPVVVTSR